MWHYTNNLANPFYGIGFFTTNSKIHQKVVYNLHFWWILYFNLLKISFPLNYLLKITSTSTRPPSGSCATATQDLAGQSFSKYLP